MGIHSDSPTTIYMDSVLWCHKGYHHASILGQRPNYINQSVMDEEKATNVGIFFNLLLLYLMKRIPTKDWPVLAAAIMK